MDGMSARIQFSHVTDPGDLDVRGYDSPTDGNRYLTFLQPRREGSDVGFVLSWPASNQRRVIEVLREALAFAAGEDVS